MVFGLILTSSCIDLCWNESKKFIQSANDNEKAVVNSNEKVKTTEPAAAPLAISAACPPACPPPCSPASSQTDPSNSLALTVRQRVSK
jgi:hypothetical protein